MIQSFPRKSIKTLPPPTSVIATPTYDMADTIKFGNLHITLNSYRVCHGKNEWFKPENDYFLILDVTIENKGSTVAHVSTLLQMKLYDADDYACDLGIFAETKGSLDGEMGPVRRMRGEIAFDVVSSPSYEVIFYDPFRSGQAIWKFQVKE